MSLPYLFEVDMKDRLMVVIKELGLIPRVIAGVFILMLIGLSVILFPLSALIWVIFNIHIPDKLCDVYTNMHI